MPFSDITPGQSSVPSGLDRDSVKPEYRAKLLALAKRRQDSSTDDTAAAFKENDRERKFSPESRVVGQ